jgi:hypothetical protein
MLALGLVLNTVGIGLFCWLIFTLAVYALPFFIAVNAGMLAFHGTGVVGASIVGNAAGAVTLAVGQTAFSIARSLILRAAIAAVFAILAWREVFACLGAVFIGGTAWTRLTVFAAPSPSESGRVVGNAPQPVLMTATREVQSSPPDR